MAVKDFNSTFLKLVQIIKDIAPSEKLGRYGEFNTYMGTPPTPAETQLYTLIKILSENDLLMCNYSGSLTSISGIFSVSIHNSLTNETRQALEHYCTFIRRSHLPRMNRPYDSKTQQRTIPTDIR